ncbi:MAG: hypothetical protein ACI97K_000329 [Glaciecola sp.]|jgi:hypothetical protein
MEIKLLSEKEVNQVSGGVFIFLTNVATVASLMYFADEIYQGYKDHRAEG